MYLVHQYKNDKGYGFFQNAHIFLKKKGDSLAYEKEQRKIN